MWEAPSPQEEKHIALEVKITEMTKKLGKRNSKRDDRGDGKSLNKKQRKKKPKWMNQYPNNADLHKPREWNNAKWEVSRCVPYSQAQIVQVTRQTERQWWSRKGKG